MKFRAAILLLLFAAQPALLCAGDDVWKLAQSGNWIDGQYWADGSAPNANDTATLDKIGVYDVVFDSTVPSIKNLAISAGTATFYSASSSTSSTLSVDAASGAGDLNLSGAGTSLTLGKEIFAYFHPVNLILADALS